MIELWVIDVKDGMSSIENDSVFCTSINMLMKQGKIRFSAMEFMKPWKTSPKFQS